MRASACLVAIPILASLTSACAGTVTKTKPSSETSELVHAALATATARTEVAPEAVPRVESFDAVAATRTETVVPAPLRLRFVGDVIFGRYREGRYHRLAKDGDPVFAEVAPLLAGDWVVANLETPLASGLPETDTRPGYFFGATAEMAAPLVDAGFDAVSLANNHAADLGVEGLRQSPRILRELGVQPLGEASLPSRPQVQEVDVQGVRIGVVAVTTHTNFPMSPEAPAVPMVAVADLADVVGPLLAEAYRSYDLLVVMVHWGVEYARYPDPVQRRAARALVEQGADLIIGHHPHVLQEIELYRDGLIAYSLGNFLFENVAPEPKLTGVLAVDIARPSLCDVAVRFDPAVMQRRPFARPVPATKGTADLARRRIPPLEEEQRKRWQRRDEALITQFRRDDCGATP